MHTGEAKLYRRAQVILYRNGGYTPDEIEVHTDYSEREQRNWVRRYREEGVEGLYDRRRSGRPRRRVTRGDVSLVATCHSWTGRPALRGERGAPNRAGSPQRSWGRRDACCLEQHAA